MRKDYWPIFLALLGILATLIWLTIKLPSKTEVNVDTNAITILLEENKELDRTNHELIGEIFQLQDQIRLIDNGYYE